MNCQNCGKELYDGQKVCTICGTPVGKNKSRAGGTDGNSKSKLWVAINTAIVIVIAGASVFLSVDNKAVEQNNEALDAFSTGNNISAVEQLETAAENAVTDYNKMMTLLNLGYVYTTDGYNEEARDAFTRALPFAQPGTLHEHLINAEIAYIDGDNDQANREYLTAYQLGPDEFQTNNALALFYMDLDGTATEYYDPKKSLQFAQAAFDYSDPLIRNVAQQNLAIAHYLNQNYDQVIELLQDFDFTVFPQLAYWLGSAYHANGDLESAKTYYQFAVDGGIELLEEDYALLEE